MQGAGNDYVYVNCFEEHVDRPEQAAITVSDRHFGIGSDGLVLICPSDKADVQMRMFNADGSEGIMCGNAIRCVGKYVYDHGLVRRSKLTVDTLGGTKELKLDICNGKVDQVTVDMGTLEVTSLGVPEPIHINGEDTEFVGISVGNPHAVYFRDDIDGLDLERIGPYYENHSRFPDRVNSEFVQVVDRRHIRMRVWERGSGETWACGTGATASAAASVLMGYTDNVVKVLLRGGELTIAWDRETGHGFMTGPAVEVFHGEILLDR
jgi:diaminopimelate epimerase